VDEHLIITDLLRGGQVARLTVNRPSKLNSLTPEAIAALRAAAERLQGNDKLRAVVLTGAGEKAFVGGADVGTLASLDTRGARAFITSLHEAIAAIGAIPVPVIARINGWTLGAGLELAIGCDLLVAAEHAMFGMPEVKVGVPSVIEAALLPRLVGWGKAAELVLLGENIDAAEAHRIGLVQKVVPMAGLDAAVDCWLDSLIAAGPLAIRLQKKLMRRWAELPTHEAILAGIDALAEAYTTDEPARLAGGFVNRRR
jgi:enoyl-CoA hydratase/carnithine racemase